MITATGNNMNNEGLPQWKQPSGRMATDLSSSN